MVGREGLHVATEAVADPLDDSGRTDRLAQMLFAEPLHLSTHLESGM